MKTRKRTKARECALQLLYQTEIAGKPNDDAEREFWGHVQEDTFNDTEMEEIKNFTHAILAKIEQNLAHIDALIKSCADNWSMTRMAVVDRNILRIGTCELVYCEDIPTKVAINESIELAKTFGDSESSKFVNGILDNIAKKQKPAIG